MALRTGINTQDEEKDIAGFLKENNINLEKNIKDDEERKKVVEQIADKYSMQEFLAYVKKNSRVTKENVVAIMNKIRETEEANRQKVEEDDKELKALGEAKRADEERKKEDMAALKALLDYDDKSNENNKEEMDYLIEDIAMNKKNEAILGDIKKLKEKLDADPKPEGKEKADLEKERKAKKEELKKIIMDKNFAYFKNFSEQYTGELKQLKTKRIEREGFNWKSIDGQRVLSGPQLKFRQNIHSRHRINRTITELNAIGNDPKKGVNFVLSKTFRSHGGRITGAFKQLSARLRIRNTKKFDEMYNEQKKYFLEDLESKMNGKTSGNDRDVIAAVKKRLDYYQAAYKRQFITV